MRAFLSACHPLLHPPATPPSRHSSHQARRPRDPSFAALDLVELGLRLDGVSAPDFTPQSELVSLAQSANRAALECFCAYPIDELFNAAAPMANVVFHAITSGGNSLRPADGTGGVPVENVMLNYTSGFDSSMNTLGVFVRTGCTDKCKQAGRLLIKLYMRIVASATDAFYHQLGMPFLPYSASLGFTQSDEVLDPFISDAINVRGPGWATRSRAERGHPLSSPSCRAEPMALALILTRHRAVRVCVLLGCAVPMRSRPFGPHVVRDAAASLCAPFPGCDRASTAPH